MTKRKNFEGGIVTKLFATIYTPTQTIMAVERSGDQSLDQKHLLTKAQLEAMLKELTTELKNMRLNDLLIELAEEIDCLDEDLN